MPRDFRKQCVQTGGKPTSIHSPSRHTQHICNGSPKRYTCGLWSEDRSGTFSTSTLQIKSESIAIKGWIQLERRFLRRKSNSILPNGCFPLKSAAEKIWTSPDKGISISLTNNRRLEVAWMAEVFRRPSPLMYTLTSNASN